MEFREKDLNAFVAKSDALGGPDCPATAAYWDSFRYVPTSIVDVSLPPNGPEYMQQMLCLYKEIAGRPVDQKLNEHTQVDIEALVHRESPYAFQSPKNRAKHYIRLGTPLEIADIAAESAFLDMGCGWGLSSEFLAQLGYRVTAVDINSLFVDLVERRARRLGLPITAVQSTFDSYTPAENSFDGILFYECFHHAIDSATLLKSIQKLLKEDGKLILSGEPIQDQWWPNWGLRLDPLSIYCMRKYGWFESGWSEPYLMSILIHSDLLPIFYDHPSPGMGRFAIAKRRWCIDGRELQAVARESDWWFEGNWLVSNRAGEASKIAMPAPISAKNVAFEMEYFGTGRLDIFTDLGDGKIAHSLQPGRNVLSLELRKGIATDSCIFKCKPWRPSELLGTSDDRALGFHLRGIEFS